MQKRLFFIPILLIIISGCTAHNQRVRPHNVGDTAEGFILPDQNGEMVSLREVLKKNRGAVIAFYPKDESRNWTPEFVEFQQNIDQFKSRNIKILGISKDNSQSHREFIEHHGLKDLTLLSDTEQTVISDYDAEHWLLPVASRVYIIVDRNRKIVFRQDTGLSLLDKQTDTLIQSIDTLIR